MEAAESHLYNLLFISSSPKVPSEKENHFLLSVVQFK